MNLFKRTTAAVALVALVSGVFSTGVSAATTAEVDAANSLAENGFINTQSDVAGYNLEQTVLRQEIAKVAANIAGLDAKSSCDNSFADVSATTPNDWACGYVEALLDKGLVSANTNFNPERNISKVEAVKLMLEAAGYTNIFTDINKWQEQTVAFAVNEGLVASFSDYDTPATRGFTFAVGNESYEAQNSEEVDPLAELLEGLTGDDEDDSEDVVSPVVSGDAELTVSLSPETPEGSTVPGGANGAPVVAFDFTAGSEDVVVEGVILKRKGLSDEDTLEALAVFGERGRVSKSRDDSQENDDQANLNFNEDEVIKAGETRTFTVVVDVARTVASNDEFAIELLDVETSANVEMEGKVIGETFRVAGVDAPLLVFEDDGTVTNPTLGETDAEIFKFEIEGADDEDVVLKAITFRSSESDVEENLRNFKLTQNNKVLAETEKTVEEYLTFDLGSEGYTIKEDVDLSFVVTADIVEGATDTFAFFIDRNLDVTAESTKFNTVASVDIQDVDEEGELGSILEIEAGELVLKRLNPEVDEIKEDKDDVTLGKFTVENQSGGDLDLEEFGVVVELTLGSNAAASGVTVENIFDDFEILNETTNRTDTLELENGFTSTRGIYSDDSLGIQIPEGTTTFVIRADTADEIPNFAEVDINLSFNTISRNSNGSIDRTNGFFIVEEQDDDEEVEDISPSFISFDNLEGIESTAELSVNPLPTTTAVRGGEGVQVLEFEVEADEASTLEIDEIRIRGEFVQLGSGALLSQVQTATGATGITNDQISRITLYLDSVSDANILESEGGTEIENNGELTFNDFENVFIQPNGTQTFVVTVDIIDGDTVENIGLRNFQVVDIDIDDEDNDDVEATPTTVTSENEILVTPAGLLTANFDESNDANEDPKTLLAGADNQTVFSIDVQSTNEPTDVEDVTFTLTGSDLSAEVRNTISNASLYLDGVFIDRNTNSDITYFGTAGTTTEGVPVAAGNATILFDDLDTLIIPEQTSELELRINTESIGFQRVGESLVDVSVIRVDFQEIEGDESDEDVNDVFATGSSETFTVARAVLTSRVSSGLNTSNPIVGIDADLGDNRATNNNATPNVLLDALRFDISGTSAGTQFTLSNTDGSTSITLEVGTDDVNNILTFDLAANFTELDDRTLSNGNEELFEIQVTPDTAAENVTVSLELLRDGMTYTVESETFTSNGSEDLEVSNYSE